MIGIHRLNFSACTVAMVYCMPCNGILVCACSVTLLNLWARCAYPCQCTGDVYSVAVKRDSQKLFLRCDRRETGKAPIRSHVAPHATAATGPSQTIAEVELGSTFAMRQAVWRTILTFSTAKLYKGSRVAYKFVQVVSNRTNIMVTYPNQQDFVASLTSSVNGISRVRIARIHRRSRRIAKKLL